MKFRYIIFNAIDGNITGTDDLKLARALELVGDRVVDVLKGEEIDGNEVVTILDYYDDNATN